MVKTSAIFGLVAKEAGVEIVVNISMLPSRRDTKSPVLMDHWLSERVLDFAGIPVTHLRASIFSEWLFYVSHLIRQGRLVMTARARVVARPRPECLPVTTTILPFKFLPPSAPCAAFAARNRSGLIFVA
jgi:hypothetical protein